jgi:hypothetical protein
MTVISVIDLRPAAKGVSSPIADQAPALDALSISRQYSKDATDAESEPAHLSDLAGGQVWVIEISPTDELSPLHRKIVTESNVMIYDRSLEAIVAEALPLGGYAEPDSSAQAAQRCVRFARDGWSVVRLVDRQTVNAGEKTHWLAGVKMDHGGNQAGPWRTLLSSSID